MEVPLSTVYSAQYSVLCTVHSTVQCTVHCVHWLHISQALSFTTTVTFTCQREHEAWAVFCGIFPMCHSTEDDTLNTGFDWFVRSYRNICISWDMKSEAWSDKITSGKPMREKNLWKGRCHTSSSIRGKCSGFWELWAQISHRKNETISWCCCRQRTNNVNS